MTKKLNEKLKSASLSRRHIFKKSCKQEVKKEPLSSLVESKWFFGSKLSKPDTLIVVIPGNPGVLTCYYHFCKSLQINTGINGINADIYLQVE